MSPAPTPSCSCRDFAVCPACLAIVPSHEQLAAIADRILDEHGETLRALAEDD